MVFDVLVAAVDAAWTASTLVVPAVFLVFLTVYLLAWREADWLPLVVGSQRDVALWLDLIAGLFLGGVITVLAGGGVVPGVVLAAAAAGYRVWQDELPHPPRCRPRRGPG